MCTMMPKLRKIVLLCSVLAAFPACQKLPTPKPAADEPAFQKPTASEVFNLRSKCAELGEKINENHDIAGAALGAPFHQEQSSHYDPKTNRCYVELRSTILIPAVPMLVKDQRRFWDTVEVDFMDRHLYDGQTGEELVSATKGAKSVGPMGFLGNQRVEWAEAFEKINDLMADDRKQ
jgi:hypothetical protein